MEIIRKCLVCGKEFKACNTCQKNISEMLQWRRVVCCPEHFVYHLPIIEFYNGIIDKATAKKQLQEAINTYGTIEFCDNVKGITEEILAEDKDISICEEHTDEDFIPQFTNKNKKNNK